MKRKKGVGRKEKALTAAELKKIAAGLVEARNRVRAAEVVVLGKLRDVDAEGFYGQYRG